MIGTDVLTHIWLTSDQGDKYWAEHVACQIDVETTVKGEVRLFARFNDDESDAAMLYFSREEAEKLARFLSAAAVSAA